MNIYRYGGDLTPEQYAQIAKSNAESSNAASRAAAAEGQRNEQANAIVQANSSAASSGSPIPYPEWYEAATGKSKSSTLKYLALAAVAYLALK